MPAHTRGPRGSSRKPRPGAGSGQDTTRQPAGGARDAVRQPAGGARDTVRQPAGGARDAARQPAGGARDAAVGRSSGRARNGRVPAYRNFDERPQSPWHPLPLSELLILGGAIAFAIALVRLGHEGLASGGPLLLVGILAVGLGTAEVSWREHRTGFRSHTLLLAFIPVLILHTVVVVGYSAFATPPRALNVVMLAVDAIVFVVLARHLRASYADARARR